MNIPEHTPNKEEAIRIMRDALCQSTEMCSRETFNCDTCIINPDSKEDFFNYIAFLRMEK